LTHTAPSRRPLTLTSRYATLEELGEALEQHAAARQDIVAPLTALHSQNGIINIAGMGHDLTDAGVTRRDGRFQPLATFDAGLSNYLPGIQQGTLRAMRTDAPDVYDEIVNRLIHGRRVRGTDGASTVLRPPLAQNVLMRLFSQDGDRPGYARALLSDSYKPMDNIDLFYLLLEAIRSAQADGRLPGEPIFRANLTEDAMDVRVRFPGISTVSDELVRGYQSPFRQNGASRTVYWRPEDGGERGERGQVDLCLRLSNGELGNRSLKLAPEAYVWECSNGQIVASEMVKAIHIGGKLEAGEIQWSADTQRAAMELATLKLRDALTKFLAPGYLNKLVAKLLDKADAPITGDPADAIKYVTDKCMIPAGRRADLIRHFSLAGDWSSKGISAAFTSLAQELDDPSAATELEWASEKAMAVAADYSRIHAASNS
jgi:hypothetical protein